MRNKIKILIRTVLLAAIVLCSPAIICYADVDLNALEGYLNSTLVKQEMDQCNNPKYSNNSNTDETVDPITGSLILKETDLSLTGKDGLDLNIGRYYNSSQDECDKKTEVTRKYHTGYYVESGYKIMVIYGDGLINYIGTYFTEADAAAVRNYYMDSVSNVVYAGVYYDESVSTYSYSTVTTNNYIDKYNYDKTRYYLGAGWSFSFPSVEIEKIGNSTYRYYHAENGAVYSITSIEDTGKTNLEGYEGNDVKFTKDTGTYVNEDNVASKYKFVDANMTTTYFGEDGRILGKKDRLGNEIKFRHISKKIYEKTYPLISQITDSVGRVITFSYEDNAIKVTVTMPGEQEQLTVQYVQEFKEAKYLKKNGSTYDRYVYPVLAKVVSPNGDEKYYEDYYHYNNDTPLEESYEYYKNSSSSQAGSSKIGRYLIGGVVYKGYKTRYDYEKITRNFGKDGITEAYRIKARYEQIQGITIGNDETLTDWEGEYNRVDYTYSGDYTGYPDYKADGEIPDTYQFWSASTDGTGLCSKTVFNGSKQQIYQEVTAANGEKDVTTYVEYNQNFKNSPTLIKNETYASDGTLVSELFTGILYTEWGGISAETKPLTSSQFNDAATKQKYTTTYFYEDTRFPYFITRQQFYQNDTKIITTSCQYDAMGRMVKITDENGQVANVQYYYNGDGDFVEETNITLSGSKVSNYKVLYGSETGFAYPKMEIVKTVNSDGSTTDSKIQMTYNMLLGLEKTVKQDEQPTITYEYDKEGNVLSVCNPRVIGEDGYTYSVTDVSEYQKGYYKEYCDKDKYLYGTTVNTHTKYTRVSTGGSIYYNCEQEFYDGYGNLRVRYSYDNKEWKQQIAYEYDNMMRPVKTTNANNISTSVVYDDWGNTKETIDARGNIYVNDYDRKNNKIMTYLVASEDVQNYRSNPSANQYKEDYVEVYQDQFGRGIERSVYLDWPSQNEKLCETYTYDYADNVVGFIDPNKNLNEDGYTKTCEYDGANQITKIKNALNQITEVTYAGDGAIEKVTIKENENSSDSTIVYEKEYDSSLNMTGKTDTSNETSSYVYDGAGQLVSYTDRNGVQETKKYDALQRITEISLVNVDNTKTMQYISSYESLYGSTEEKMYENSILKSWYKYSYNKSGDVAEKKSGTSNFRTSLTMDYTGDVLTSLGVKSSDSDYFYTRYKISDEGLLTQVQIDGNKQLNSDEAANVQYSYCADGNVEKVSYPSVSGSELETLYEYNNLSRLATLTNRLGDSVLSKYEYEYDGNGNITCIKDNGKVINYIYDKLNRLIEVRSTEGESRNYSYDLLGNRLEGNVYQEDLESCEYQYDLDNRLITVTGESGTTNMEYYPDGLRSRKTNGSKTTAYVYDENQRLVAEAEDSSDITANYIWDNDKVIAKVDSNAKEYFYLYNGHGDVVQIIDTDGNIVNSYEYDEWGVVIASDETISNPFKYTCAVYDDEIGCYYLNARYYDPAVGRFLTEDNCEGDIGNVQSLNSYVYCLDNPLLFMDSTGNKPKSIQKPKNNLLDRSGFTKLSKAYKNFCNFTKSEKSRKIFDTCNFRRDKNGIFHVDVKCWQRIFGYCDVYDTVFNLATDMRKAKYEFSNGKTDMVIWLWKGDYLNLGAGCELGIYYKKWNVDFYRCYTQSDIKMTLRLEYKGNVIANYKPTEAQWWITAFNPKYMNADASDLKAKFVLSFKNTKDVGLYSAMKTASRGKNSGQWKNVVFNDKKKTVTFLI